MLTSTPKILDLTKRRESFLNSIHLRLVKEKYESAFVKVSAVFGT